MQDNDNPEKQDIGLDVVEKVSLVMPVEGRFLVHPEVMAVLVNIYETKISVMENAPSFEKYIGDLAAIGLKDMIRDSVSKAFGINAKQAHEFLNK